MIQRIRCTRETCASTRREGKSSRRVVAFLLGGAALVSLAPLRASAEPPTPAADADAARWQESFDGFAAVWMKRLQRNAVRADRVASGGSSGVTYRTFDPEFETEVHPTGDPAAPCVGTLRYIEHVHQCSDVRALDCRVSQSTPVVELFHVRDGRWIY